MKKLLLFFLLAATAAPASAQQDSLKAVVIRFFDGLSNLSENALRAEVTPDFELLEDGEVWSLKTLTDQFTLMRERTFTRKNFFKFYTMEVRGETAWVSYDNRAEITVTGRPPIPLHWLESAVLFRERDGRWKIRMLHSTKINDKKGGQ
ncbi:MAG: nuclear transport factor 2 family protein [Chitinophagaceae bacterium]|nr:MAG: nuclear transport factor 2 family protein [Chitinophagaceae bacterium]